MYSGNVLCNVAFQGKDSTDLSTIGGAERATARMFLTPVF